MGVFPIPGLSGLFFVAAPEMESMMYFDPIKFGKRLQKSRKLAGITQEELANSLSVDRNTIGRMERGIRSCSFDLLVEICSILNVSSDYLLMGKDEIKVSKEELLKTVSKLNTIVQNL